MKLCLILLLITILSSGEIVISPDSLYRHVEVLTTTPEYRNHINIASLDSAARYIKRKFKDYGLKVDEQVYEVKGNEYRNIIGKVGPETEECIIIGAHYDVCLDQPGADDNASGVAGLIELARILSENRDSLKTEIQLIGYTLEEPPHFNTVFMGSAVHARHCDIMGQKIKYMISLEMIGFFSDTLEQDYSPKILKMFMPNKANFISVVGKRAAKDIVRGVCRSIKKNTKIKSRHLIVPRKVRGLDLSDHMNYQYNNVKALMITDTSFMRNIHYHQKSDTIDKLDFNKMAAVVKGTACFILY